MNAKPKINEYFTLFLTFLKIGAFTFGGGYAMIPLIQRETVENHKWISEEDMVNMIAIAESTPGVLAVNSATFVGYRVAGFWGSLWATVGVTLPSFLIICILSLFYRSFLSNQYVTWAFSGIRCAVVVLMFNAVRKLSKSCRLDLFHIVLGAAAFLLAALTGFDTMFIILGAGLIGIGYALWNKNRASGKEGE